MKPRNPPFRCGINSMGLFGRRKLGTRGMTMVEIIIAVAIAAAIFLVIGKVIGPIMKVFQRTQIRQFSMRENRICIDTIRQMMSKGRISTLYISNGPSGLPSSSAEFTTVDNERYQVLWSSEPANSVHLKRISPAPATDKIIGGHIAQLSFLLDVTDPGIVHFTLQSAFPLDASGKPDTVFKTFVSNQTVLMNAS